MEVLGLLVGARGTIPGFLATFWKSLLLPTSILKEITIATIRGSLQVKKKKKNFLLSTLIIELFRIFTVVNLYFL